MRWAGHGKHSTGKILQSCEIFVQTTMLKGHVGNVHADGKIMLKCISKTRVAGGVTDICTSVWGTLCLYIRQGISCDVRHSEEHRKYVIVKYIKPCALKAYGRVEV
jgi:hypothetical protein